jgi:CDP-glycerol glycerophosphotransferase (TagB/SpsB family)
VSILSQENQWVAAARNAGLELVDADWVTFSDPDDAFDDRYFEEVVKFIDLHGHTDVALLAAHQMRLTDDGALSDTHPLRAKFGKRSRIVDLEIEPVIQMSVNSAFFRVDALRRAGVSFDGRVRPVFEDAHFIGRYLLQTGGHILGLMSSAKYHYRIRSDGSSLMQTYFHRPEKYTSVPRYGHLDLLRLAQSLGPIPRWLEYIVLYDLFWYFKDERGILSPTAAAPPEVFGEFHELISEVTSLLDPDSIRAFNVMWVEEAIRLALTVGYRDPSYRAETVSVDRVDEIHQTVSVSYWFTGGLPEERFLVDGETVEPLFETVQDFVFFGRTLMRQRHAWLRRGENTTVTLDGRRRPFTLDERPAALEVLTFRQLRPLILEQRSGDVERFTPLEQTVAARLRARVDEGLRGVRDALRPDARFDRRLEWALRSKKVREKYANAWVFMDRDTDANDNAEHLYRHVTKAHPEVNAWFVLERSSRDWQRLEAEGFKLVDYGSFDWHLLLFHAAHLASSHIDQYVVDPLREDRYGRRRFQYTFLQHGVINYDISRWLNTKSIDLFVTTTPQEHQAIAGPGQYRFSSREVVLTGLPRHDELIRKRRSSDKENLILVSPTWRKKLSGEQILGSNERAKNPEFMNTEFARQYQALLRSPRLHDLAAATGKRLAFMPHPNIRPYLSDFDLPSHVAILDFAKDNVQDVLARTSAFVTDYSSLAFDAAFLDIPLVYFQFDEASFFDGSHVGRRGTFDYGRDGFGEVAYDVEAVESALSTIAEAGFVLSSEFLARTSTAFVTRDEDNSERTYQAMRALDGGPRLVESPQVASGLAAVDANEKSASGAEL